MSKTFDQLTANDAKKLLAIKSGKDIKSMELLDEFEDDHIACAHAKINGVALELLWCGPRVVGALDISDSKQAKQVVFMALESAIHADVNMMFDMDEADLAKVILKPLYKVVLAHLRDLPKTNSLRKEVAGYLANSKVVSL
jgi:hypothetical protein